MDASDLHIVGIGNCLHSFLLSHQLGQLDVHRGSHGGTEVSWAGRNVTEMVVMGEFANSFNMLGGSAESLEDACDVGSWLHGDDSKLVLFVDPDEEGLGIVVENTSA